MFGRVEDGSQGGFVTVDVDERGEVIQCQHTRRESENNRTLGSEHGVKRTPVGPFYVDAAISSA